MKSGNPVKTRAIWSADYFDPTPSKPGKPAVFTIVTRGPKNRGDSIRTDRWRYTEWSDGSRELYDQTADPEETTNLVADPQRKSVVRQLSNQLIHHKTTLKH